MIEAKQFASKKEREERLHAHLQTTWPARSELMRRQTSRRAETSLSCRVQEFIRSRLKQKRRRCLQEQLLHQTPTTATMTGQEVGRRHDLDKFARSSPSSFFLALFAIASIIAQLTPNVGCSPSSFDNNSNKKQQQEQRQSHPPLLVSTKYWIRNMEFGERDNWASGLRPCTLLERISIDQSRAVISLGDLAMDSSLMPANIKEFHLPLSGVLLLEEDTLQVERDYINFLSRSGDCFDSSSLPERLQDLHWFRFKPHSDELSWFNAANWAATANGDLEFEDLIPNSHQVPCSEDVVVFGSRHSVSWFDFESDERSQVIPFKVNFSPSEHFLLQLKNNNQTNDTTKKRRTNFARDNLRVSKLKIGEKIYKQEEFNRVMELYGNYLFDFDDSYDYDESMLDNQINPNQRLEGLSRQNLLTIDESSIRTTSDDLDLCLDEAGCQCGNEHSAIMDLICSFNEAIEPQDLPCIDPIQSAGYCNRICATSLSITMDPNKFSEPFIVNLLNKLLSGDLSSGPEQQSISTLSQDQFDIYIAVGPRRVDYNKYEITLRLAATNNDVYHKSLGKDIEFAQIIKQHLDEGESHFNSLSFTLSLVHLNFKSFTNYLTNRKYIHMVLIQYYFLNP